MDLKLAELFESVPPEFTATRRTSDSATMYRFENKEIHIEWWDGGKPYAISYYENGRLHRPIMEGPAYQSWFKNGQPALISYWENGRQTSQIK